MFSYVMPRALNTMLRVLALGSRFVLLIAMARLYSPGDVGLFGLFVATIAFSIQIIGGDYYTYALRELMSSSVNKWSFVIQHQAMGTSVLYILLIPLQLLIFYFDFLPEKLIGWFFLLLVMEHLAQELNRMLNAIQKPLLASLVLFIRHGVWVWVILPVLWFSKDEPVLDAIFFAWLSGDLAAVLIGGWIIYRSAMPWRWWTPDYKWIAKGFRVGLMFITGTLSIRALFSFDRYAVEMLAGPELLGVYVLYIGVAMSIANFADPAIFSFLYPKVVSACRKGRLSEYRKSVVEMTISAVFLSIVMGLVLVLLAPTVFHWTGREIYLEHLSLFNILVGAAAIHVVSLIPHYMLYARGADRSILISHTSSLLIFGLVIVLLREKLPLEATAYGLVAAFCWMGMVNVVTYLKLPRMVFENRQYRKA